MDISFFKATLIAMRSELQASQERTGDDRKPVELDQQAVGRLSRMDAMQRQAMALESERRRAMRLGRVDAALKRIEDESFGYCALCDEEIGEQRLALDPTIPTCVNCAGGSAD